MRVIPDQFRDEYAEVRQGRCGQPASASLFDRLCEIIEGQNVSEWQGGIHPEDVGHLARALIAAGVTMPELPCECAKVVEQDALTDCLLNNRGGKCR